MAGIYVHIPFCKQACHYCNFHFSTSLGLKEQLLKALGHEIALQADYLAGAKIETIYFGGGTPSILNAKELDYLLNLLHKHHPISEELELTLEANPDDLTDDKLSELSDLGINRLSIGIQSFFDKDLEWMNRSHNAAEAHRAIVTAQDKGITDLSIDLIFGSRTTSMEMWIENLTKAIELDIPHLSCYSLTVEEGTALAHQIKTGKQQSLDNLLGAEQFQLTTSMLQAANYEHYEISNYAKDGRYSKHNTNYWLQVPYLGLGPAAHSYNGVIRQWNIANNMQYIKSLAENKIPANTETLSITDRYNEGLMTGLRTMWGCSTETLDKLYPTWRTATQQDLESLQQNDLILITDDRIKLTEKGKLLADQVMSQLFITD